MKGGLWGGGRLSRARPRGFACGRDLHPGCTGRPLNRNGMGLVYGRGVNIEKGEYPSPSPLFQSLEDIAGLELGLPTYPRGPLRASGDLREMMLDRPCAGPQTGGSGRASILEEVFQKPKLLK